MAWQVKEPRFEIATFESGEGWWYWTLFNDNQVVASTEYAGFNQHWSRETAMDCARWLKSHPREIPIPIIGEGILEL